MGKEKQGRHTKMNVLGIAGAILAVLFLVVVTYVLYVMLSYHRIEDNVELVPEHVENIAGKSVAVDTEYSITTYNIGFGAYTPEFSFFMDGGISSVAESKESMLNCVNKAAAFVKESVAPDFMLWQEVDIDATRSYHVDQYALLKENFREYDSVFAMNYDSAFLFWPLTEPHGKSKAGLVTFSNVSIESSLRRSFPISTSFSKFFDLDRCYSISKIPVENGRYLCLFNLHMSAYGNSDAIREGQIAMVCADMQAEYDAGNYVVCGGDFNHDLKLLNADEEGIASWAYPFPRESLPEGFSFIIDSFSEEEKAAMWNSARNADEAYNPDTTYTVTLDGFIISDNIKCLSYENIKTGYQFSDHDPVSMNFLLQP